MMYPQRAISGTLGAGFGYHDPTYSTDPANPAGGESQAIPGAAPPDDPSALVFILATVGLLLLMARG